MHRMFRKETWLLQELKKVNIVAFPTGILHDKFIIRIISENMNLTDKFVVFVFIIHRLVSFVAFRVNVKWYRQQVCLLYM